MRNRRERTCALLITDSAEAHLEALGKNDENYQFEKCQAEGTGGMACLV